MSEGQPLERIEANLGGRPKVSRSACDCGSLDLRPAGWTPDERQRVQCRGCKTYFSLPPGMVQGKPRWRPDAINHEPKKILACPRCGSADFNSNGSQNGRRRGECRNCGHYFYLAFGQEFAGFRATLDSRPACPFCDGETVKRHELIRLASGEIARRWHCRPCNRRFVTLDPGEGHWYRHEEEPISVDDAWEVVDDAAEEAAALFTVAKSEDDFEGMRETIAYSENQKRCLQILCDAGMLASNYVQDVLSYRDRILERFNSLVNVELQVLVESYEKKEEQTVLQYPAGDELVSQKDDDR